MKSTGSQDALYQAIEAFDIDGGPAEYSFHQRLAHEQKWSPAFAEKVIGEYKKFVYLAMVAGHPVTPSEQVDQAWHLHLTYTRSYWERLCGQILPRPLHHEPTKGGKAESEKFDDWYSKTLDSYTRIFGVEPLKDIWPNNDVRFNRDTEDSSGARTTPSLSRIDKYSNRSTRIALTLVLSFVAVGCTWTNLVPFATSEAEAQLILLVAFFVVLIVAILYLNARGRQRRRRDQGADSGCSAMAGLWGTCGSSLPRKSKHNHDDSSGCSASGCSSSSSSSGDSSNSGCSSSGCSGGGGGCGGGGCGGGD